jgi:tetratricopeptide (TPR) repeat protein
MIDPLKLSSLIITSGAVRAAQLQELSAARLLAQAERAYLSRDIAGMSRAADALLMLQSEGARAAGLFYRAMCERRAGREIEAARLFASVASCPAAPRFRARAMQALGLARQYQGEYTEAVRLYGEAITASHAARDAVAFVRAGLTLSEVQSENGNHDQALDHLRAIRPAVEVLGKAEPFYLHLFANEVAFELLQAGRLNEARRFAAFALASPVALAYPEWLETAQAIERQAEAKAALNARPAVQQARKTSPKSKLRLVKKPRPQALPASTRRRIGPVAVIRPEPPRSRSILEQICLKIRIRAPSF